MEKYGFDSIAVCLIRDLSSLRSGTFWESISQQVARLVGEISGILSGNIGNLGPNVLDPGGAFLTQFPSFYFEKQNAHAHDSCYGGAEREYEIRSDILPSPTGKYARY